MLESQLWDRQLRLTPLGGQTLSKLPSRFTSNYPKMLEKGIGAIVQGSNGRTYLDLIAGLGAVSVGYSNQLVNQASVRQLLKGVSFSLPNKLEADLAEALCTLVSWTEMWKFGKTGTQANEYAVRAARAYTGRTKIMTVGYNGCNDQFEVMGTRNAGVPEILKGTITKAEFNNLDSFRDLVTVEYACVLMEPMVYEYPNIEFLERVKDLCYHTGTLLIFDEVVTGGRFEGFLASDYFKVQPDLVTCGKGLANGFPLSAIGGKREVMRVFERDDFFASGTFGGETVSLAAALQTLDILAETIPESVGRGKRIQEAFNQLFRGLAECVGYPTRLKFNFPTKEHQTLWMQEMADNGVLTGTANFVMADLTDMDMERILDAMIKTYAVMQGCWDNPLSRIRGELPTEALKR